MTTVQIDIEQALTTLGDVLESRGVACEIVVVGGGACQLRAFDVEEDDDAR